jgi:hypothetical protein
MYFDGTGDYLNCPASPNLAFGSGDYTAEFWAYTTTTGQQIVFGSGSTSTNNFYISIASTYVGVGTQVAFVSQQTTTINTNTWYHIAACRAGGTLRLFVNGLQIGSNVTDSTTWLSDGTAKVGASNANTVLFNGYIDDLRITKGVARYLTNFTPPTSQLQDQ